MTEDQQKSRRRDGVESLYVRNYKYIKDLTHADPKVTVIQSDQMLSKIAEHLDDYSGPLADVAFKKWASDIVLPVVGFYAVKHICEGEVKKVIRKVFKKCRDLCNAAELQQHMNDAEQNTWLWAVLHIDQLMDPTKATSMIGWVTTIAKCEARTIRRRLERAKARFDSHANIELMGFEHATSGAPEQIFVEPSFIENTCAAA